MTLLIDPSKKINMTQDNLTAKQNIPGERKYSEISDLWTNLNLRVFKKNNLVYVSTLKCGHTYYSNIALHNGWTQIEFNDIDWLSDHAFGFIMDPVERYLKGLAEDLVTDDEITAFKELIKNHTLKNFTMLTLHSMPISMRYKEYMYKIDWIPLNAQPTSEFFLKKLCSEYDIEIDIPNKIYRHVGEQIKLDRYKEFKNMFGNFNETFYRVFSTDIDFYYMVDSNFNPYGKSWKEISWLKNINDAR